MANLEALIKKSVSRSHIKQIHAHLVTTGKFQTCRSRTKLIELCALSPNGDVAAAGAMLGQINCPLTNDWNAVIRGLANCPEPTEAISLYCTMKRGFHRPDALTCSFVLKACARGLAPNEAMQIHSQCVRYGFLGDMLLRTTLLDVYAKAGVLDFARCLFDEMPVRDVAMWNALIIGLAQGSQPNEAISLFQWMRIEEVETGLKPNEVTVIGALSACSQLGAFKEGEKVFAYIKSENLDMNIQVSNAVIDMYGKCGRVEKAYEAFSNMRCHKSLVSWNTMIMAFAMHGCALKALELFEDMGKEDFTPDGVTYLSVLCACNHAGLVEDGLRLFNTMAKKGVNPSIKHFGSVVDLLGRAGRLREAYEIITSMCTDPDTVLWQTMLGASKTHGNVEMAEIASKKLEEMGSKACGDFVLLSNIYAARGRWDDVGRVREAMKSKDVKKIPGFSYVDVGGIMHKFVNGDQSHPSWGEIYRKLDEIRFRIREYGYIAETNIVLHDIGEEDKENALCHHSEKLAVAFGLISTSKDTSIQVIKNLRICGDCHAMIKLIAKIYNREIIVRDRSRFHKFNDGECSCGDYW
ncbi:unnamed protein product [Rhodiola kirilowii]